MSAEPAGCCSSIQTVVRLADAEFDPLSPRTSPKTAQNSRGMTTKAGTATDIRWCCMRLPVHSETLSDTQCMTASPQPRNCHFAAQGFGRVCRGARAHVRIRGRSFCKLGQTRWSRRFVKASWLLWRNRARCRSYTVSLLGALRFLLTTRHSPATSPLWRFSAWKRLQRTTPSLHTPATSIRSTMSSTEATVCPSDDIRRWSYS